LTFVAFDTLSEIICIEIRRMPAVMKGESSQPASQAIDWRQVQEIGEFMRHPNHIDRISRLNVWKAGNFIPCGPKAVACLIRSKIAGTVIALYFGERTGCALEDSDRRG
jgi:hypothetical protein